MVTNITQKSSGASALRTPYLRVVHLELSSPSATGTGGLNPFGAQFTPDEEEEFNEMARGDGFYERFAKSVAPSIFGSLGIFLPRLALTSDLSLSRYQKSHYLSPLWRVEKDFTRWHAAERGHQRLTLGRSWDRKESAFEVR